MKTFLASSAAALSLLFAAPQTVSATAQDDLENVIQYAEDVKSYAQNAVDAANDLATLYFYYHNSNIGGQISVIENALDELEEATDEIFWSAQSAANKSGAVDPSDIQSWASQMEGIADYAYNTSGDLHQAIAMGYDQYAYQYYQQLLSYLNDIIELADETIEDAQSQLTLTQAYNVRIELLYYGQVYTGSTTLGGFYAYNQNLGQYFYPDYYNDYEFSDLPGGTYTFGSYQGYFDGTNTVVVTLDPSLEGNDGFITVQLNYWSE